MDGASLAVFRIAVGFVGLLSVVRLLAQSWATTRYSGPERRFTYLGFGWVPKPSEGPMVALLVTVGIAALLVMVGWWYRLAIAAFFIGFTWVELIDVTTYLNHYWFVSLVAFVLCFLPADRAFSVSAWRRDPAHVGPAGIPMGALCLLRAQVAVVYLFAGLAKLNHDWLVRAIPLRLWLPARDGLGVLDGLLDERWFAHALAVTGAAFDCSIVPLLLWRRTRPFAFAAVVVFHVVTWRLFAIGVFPWIMIAGATLFFAPDWPRRLGLGLVTPGAVPRPSRPPSQPGRADRLVLAAGVVWMAIQVALPLRHHLYPGAARWTHEGYRFSWNVLATERAGDVLFRLNDRTTGLTWADDARSLYTADQWRLMATEPDLIHQAALELARQARAEGHTAVEVRVDAYVSLNGRPPARLIDPRVDLAAEPRDLWPDRWIEAEPNDPAP